MNGFKFDFSKIFWGGAHRAPSPDPSPDFSRASPSVRASPSILGRFALSTRASPSIFGRFAPSIRGFALNFRFEDLVWPPQNKFLDPPLVTGDRYYIRLVYQNCSINGFSLLLHQWRRQLKKSGRVQQNLHYCMGAV